MPNKKKSTSFIKSITKTVQQTIDQLMESQRRRDEELIKNIREMHGSMNTRLCEVEHQARGTFINSTAALDSGFESRHPNYPTNSSMAVGNLDNEEYVAPPATMNRLQRHVSHSNDIANPSSISGLPSTSRKRVDGLEKTTQITSNRENSTIENNITRQRNDVPLNVYNNHIVQPPCVNCQPSLGPSFTPIDFSSCGHSPALQSKPSFKPHYVSTYDGSTSWTDYERQVEDAARFYGWSCNEKLMAVTSNLRGRALRLYGTIPSNPTPTYEQVRQLMRERFSLDAHASYQYFRQCVQGPRESVEDFAMELERLSLNAFQGVPQEVTSEIVVHQFIDGLRDTQLHGLVVASRPRCIGEALRTTQDLQSQINRAKPRSVYHVEVEPECNTGGSRKPQKGNKSGNEEASA
ncbi:uncharacterized protein LOC135952221 [Calliphora vicina]|uniref:uncharacterized protein LOC135952221 n=1 Tax=Calliphora vicina TaxID=7373 RepID=UPI00325AAED9